MLTTKLTSRSYALALVLSLVTLVAPFVPFAGVASANHPSNACLDISPETDTNPTFAPNNEHTLTASLKLSVVPTPPPVAPQGTCSGAPVVQPQGSGSVKISFEVSGPNDPQNDDDTPDSPDLSCSIAEGASSCQTSYTGTKTGATVAPSTDTIRGWVDEDKKTPSEPGGVTEADKDEVRDENSDPNEIISGPDDTDVVEKTWANYIDCTPETDSNAPGTGHTVTCTVKSGPTGVVPVPNARVDAEATGANDPDAAQGGNTPLTPDFSCETDANGACSFTHGPGGTGTTFENGTTTYRAWVDVDGDHSTTPKSHGTTDNLDTAEAQSPDDTDNTDVVTKTWGAVLDCYPEGPETADNTVRTTHTVTCEARSGPGNVLTQDLQIDVEATGVNDPDGNPERETPDFTCTTDAEGKCTFQHGPDPEDGRAETTDQVGITTYRAWIDADGDNAVDEADHSEARNEATTPGARAEPDSTDVVESRWTADLDCDPEIDRNPSTAPHTVTCTATDESDAIVANVPVDVEAVGANDPDGNADRTTPDFTCETGPDGSCSFTHGPGGTHNTNSQGTVTYRAWVDVDRTNANPEGDATEGRDESATPGTKAEDDDTDVVEKSFGAARLDCEPETDFNPTASSHTVTCTATDGAGARVAGEHIDVEVTDTNDPSGDDSPGTPDFTCTTDVNGTCSFMHGPGTATEDAGTTTYRAWVDIDKSASFSNEVDATEGRDEGATPGATPEPDNTDVVVKTWTPSQLECTPPTATNEVGTSHTVTCTARAADNAPSPGVNIDVEASGTNDPDSGDSKTEPDFTCTTDQNGACSFTHGPPNTDNGGTTTYRAWVDRDGSDASSEADATEGANEGTTPGASPEVDDTDVVTKTWQRVPRLDCDDETGPDRERETNPAGPGAASNETYTCTIRDRVGNLITDATAAEGTVRAEVDRPIDGNDNIVNDPDVPDGASYSSQDYTCDASSSGTDPGRCEITVTQEENELGTAEICFWLGAAGDGATLCPSEEIGESQSPDGSDTGNDMADRTEKTWVQRAPSGIDAEPETDTNRRGQPHTISVTVYDQFGDLFQGNTTVSLEFFAGSPSDADGNTPSPAAPDRTCTTNNDADCDITYTQSAAGGIDLACVWINSAPVLSGSNANGTCDGEPLQDPGEDDTADTFEAPEPATDDVDVVQKIWEASRLNCDPEDETNPTGTNHEIECTVTDGNNDPVPGVHVDAEITGVNDPDNPDSDSPTSPDLSCITLSTGKCTLTHMASQTLAPGESLYRAWIDIDNNNTSTESDPDEARDETATAGTTSEPDNTDVVRKEWIQVPSRLECTPETDTNPTYTSHTVTCTTRDANNLVVPNTNVDIEATGINDPGAGNSPTSPDFSCTTGQNGTCSFTHGPGGTGTSNSPGTTTYRAWIDSDGSDESIEADDNEGRNEGTSPGTTPEPDETDVVEKTWILVAARLDCDPETDTNPTYTGHQVTCTARDVQNVAVPGAAIDIEATGTNDPDSGDTPASPDFTCTTATNGTCSFTHGTGGTGTSNSPGTTTYRAWIDSNGNHSANPATHGTFEGDATEQQSPEDVDNTDVVEKTWILVAARLDCGPETDTNPTYTAHQVTCTARDVQNVAVPGAAIDVEATGPNDPDAANSPTSPDFGCTTGQNGSCSFTHGPGGTGTSNSPGTTTYRAWIDADGANGTTEADADEARDEVATAGDDPEPDDTDVIEKTWILVAARLDCDPETDTNPTGSGHVVTCTAKDVQDVLVPDAVIDAEATGTNDPDAGDTPASPDFGCTTGQNGTCSFTHGPGGTGTTSDPGTTTYRAWLDADGDSSVEADTTETQSPDDADNTDVVQNAWKRPTLDCSQETSANLLSTTNQITCAVTDVNGDPVPGQGIDVEATGANDPDSGDTPLSPDFICSTGLDGSCTVTHDPVGPGIEGTTTYRAWMDVDGLDTNSEADVSEGRDETTTAGDIVEGDQTDVVEAGWQRAPGALISLSPEETKGALGQRRTITATVRDALGQPIEGATVSWVERGPGDFFRIDATTDENGRAQAVLRSTRPGRESVTATTSPCATEGDCSARAVIFWGPTRCDIYGTSGSDVLRGTSRGEVVCGFGGRDRLIGRGGADTLIGAEGNDTLRGGRGNDLVVGRSGNDRLRGGSGNDRLRGGSGRDGLDGGRGTDNCTGGPGRDRFADCETVSR